MAELPPKDNRVWERLIDLLCTYEENVSDAEIDAELRHAGIDIQSGLRRFHLIIEERKARQRLARAGQLRAAALTQLRDVFAPAAEVHDDIRNLITRLFSGAQQAAQFHKLEKAASDEDLKSLLDDLQRLAALRRFTEQDEDSAE